MDYSRRPFPVVRLAGGIVLAGGIYWMAVALLNGAAAWISRLGVSAGINWPGHPLSTQALWDFGSWIIMLTLAALLAAAVLRRMCGRPAIRCAAILGAILLTVALWQRTRLYWTPESSRVTAAWADMMRQDARGLVSGFELFVFFPFAPWLAVWLLNRWRTAAGRGEAGT